MDHKILQGDSRVVLKDVKESSVDLVWFSPPYGDIHKYTTDDREIGQCSSEEYIKQLGIIAHESFRILKPSGNFVINIMDRVENKRPVPYGARCIKAFTDLGYQWIESIVWHIPNKMPVANDYRFVNKMEWVIHFSKTDNYYFDKDSVREEHSKYALKDKRLWKWNTKGKCPGNLWTIPAYKVSGSLKKHQAAFPIELCYRVIKSWCPSDGVVLDPFCGSGTSNVAAKQLGRSSIGIELSQSYAEVARYRLDHLEEENKNP
jgi:DNA modification methylase